MSTVPKHLIAALLGAVLAGIVGVLSVPNLFWGLLIGGAMTGGAISVARELLGGHDG